MNFFLCSCAVETIVYTISLLIHRTNPFANSTGQTLHLVFYVLVGFINFVLGYLSFILLPLGDASALVLSTPVYTCLLAWLLLGERINWFHVPLLLLNVLGVICLAQPQSLRQLLNIPSNNVFLQNLLHPLPSSRLPGICCALSAAFTSALMFVSNRFLTMTSLPTILWWWALGSCFLSLPTLFLLKNLLLLNSVRLPQNSYEVCLLLVNVVSSIVAQLLLTLALKLETANSISLIRSGDVALAYILQFYFVPGEQSLQLLAALGAMMILFSICFTVWQTKSTN